MLIEIIVGFVIVGLTVGSFHLVAMMMKEETSTQKRVTSLDSLLNPKDIEIERKYPTDFQMDAYITKIIVKTKRGTGWGNE